MKRNKSGFLAGVLSTVAEPRRGRRASNEGSLHAPLLLLGFAGLGLAAFWPDDHDIRIYDQHWSLRQSECEVTFSATNQRASEVTRQVRMLVLAQHWPAGGDVVVSKTIGAKVIALRLRPHETRSVTELVSLLPGAKPWIVNITDFPAPPDVTPAPD